MARRSVHSRAAALLVPLAALLVVAYFVWHGLHGAYGFWAAKQLDVEAERLEAQLAGLVATREELQRQVALLRPDSLDPDMLDERARALLNRTHPDDLVILRDER